MIQIVAVGEPAEFDKYVRTPGIAFLKTTPQPSGNQWREHDYWRRSHNHLFDAYKGICAYCASWTIRPEQNTRPVESSIDHFIPKCDDPRQAYEWDNYRLSRRRLNERKGNHHDVIDPFVLIPGWFKINFRTFLLEPNSKLSAVDRARVKATIERLQLNADNDYVNERSGVVREYCLGNVNLDQLSKRYPFIATEMRDQDFDTQFLQQMKAYFDRSA